MTTMNHLNNIPPHTEHLVNSGQLDIETAIKQLGQETFHAGHQITAGRLAVQAAFDHPDDKDTVLAFSQTAREHYTRARKLDGQPSVMASFQLGQLPLYEELAQNRMPDAETIHGAYEGSLREIYDYLQTAPLGRAFGHMGKISFVLPLQRLAAEGQYDRLAVTSDYGGHPQKKGLGYGVAILGKDPRTPEKRIRIGDKGSTLDVDIKHKISVVDSARIFTHDRREAPQRIVLDDEYAVLSETASLAEKTRADQRAATFVQMTR